MSISDIALIEACLLFLSVVVFLKLMLRVRWEYIQYPQHLLDLTKMGQDGWELVQVLTDQGAVGKVGPVNYYIFKRQK